MAQHGGKFEAAVEVKPGHRQDLGQRRTAADFEDGFDTVTLRHHDVGDHQIRLGLLPQPHPFDAVACGDDLVASVHKTELNAPPNGSAVVDHQDGYRHLDTSEKPHSA